MQSAGPWTRNRAKAKALAAMAAAFLGASAGAAMSQEFLTQAQLLATFPGKTVQSKSRTNEVHPMGDGRYSVVSGTSGNVYDVHYSPTGCRCNCSWGQYRPGHDTRSGCSHSIAVMNFVAQEAGKSSVSAWTSAEDAQRQHRQTVDIGDGVLVTVRA